jgi:hypothetical protein
MSWLNILFELKWKNQPLLNYEQWEKWDKRTMAHHSKHGIPFRLLWNYSSKQTRYFWRNYTHPLDDQPYLQCPFNLQKIAMWRAILPAHFNYTLPLKLFINLDG